MRLMGVCLQVVQNVLRPLPDIPDLIHGLKRRLTPRSRHRCHRLHRRSLRDEPHAGSRSQHQIDTTRGILDRASELSGTPYGRAEKSDVALRVVADELETLIADDLWPMQKYRELLFQY